MPRLARLVHGSTAGMAKMIAAFQADATPGAPEASKIQIKAAILSIAEYGKRPTGGMAWQVRPATLTELGLSDLLTPAAAPIATAAAAPTAAAAAPAAPSAVAPVASAAAPTTSTAPPSKPVVKKQRESLLAFLSRPAASPGTPDVTTPAVPAAIAEPPTEAAATAASDAATSATSATPDSGDGEETIKKTLFGRTAEGVTSTPLAAVTSTPLAAADVHAGKAAGAPVATPDTANPAAGSESLGARPPAKGVRDDTLAAAEADIVAEASAPVELIA